MRGHHGQHAAGDSRQWADGQTAGGGCPCAVPSCGSCSPHLLGQSPVCLNRAAALHSTGTIQDKLLCPALCAPTKVCRTESIMAHHTHTELQREQQESSEPLQWGDCLSQLNTTYHPPAHTAPGCSASSQVSLQPGEQLLKNQGNCFAFEWCLGLQGWLKCESLTAVPHSTSTVIQSEQLPGPDWCSSSTRGASTLGIAWTDWLL